MAVICAGNIIEKHGYVISNTFCGFGSMTVRNTNIVTMSSFVVMIQCMFHEKVAMNKSIPKSNRNEGLHTRSNRPMWMNDTALVKVKSKNEAYKCHRNTMDVKDYEKYAKARNQARWECRKAKNTFERTLAKEAKRNPKAIFSSVNSKLKTKTGIADLDIETGKATTDSEKAEALNKLCSDAFTD